MLARWSVKFETYVTIAARRAHHGKCDNPEGVEHPAMNGHKTEMCRGDSPTNPSNGINFYRKVSSFSTCFRQRKSVVNQQVELRINAIQRLPKRER